MSMVPDTLHLEMRVGEEFLTQVFQVFIMDRNEISLGGSNARRMEEKQRRLARAGATIGLLISNNEGSNFKIRTVDGKGSKICKIGMNNDRLRKIFLGFEALLEVGVIFSAADLIQYSDEVTKLRAVVQLWISLTAILTTDEDMTQQDANHWQGLVDSWGVIYFD